ncbi:anti-sigma factor [Daejeonella lutea]|uniref:Regulator of SigK n=1 Tax=Daejeonella lutea TaxID=572036 RepID=A0A1T5AJQ6_9SPHI|nr:anti-sigma factor [Daejeonella lutea]SKB35252.1 Anti-sigma-K factor RskA [Daejeonella lutea]
MKDLKTYLESGILELYVLGDLSREEIREVEQSIAQYPEVKAEVEAIENALQAYAISNAIEPSESVRSKILNSLETSPVEEARVTHLRPVESSSSFYKYAFAASVALLLVSVILLINLNNRLRESHTQLAVLQAENQQFSNRVNYMDKELEDNKKFLEIYQQPGQYKLVNLKGSPKAPAARMTVAFSPQKEEVMIDLSSLNMPSNDDQHQYQLWALVDGKPVDLGVFDSTDDHSGMKRMKSVKGAQAFAVTLEPKGGSVNPTMEQMMAIGNI